jgi:DNA-binding transcriptional ArsR family regulator
MTEVVDPDRLDAVLDAMASPWRRRILYLLRERGPVGLDDLVDWLGTWNEVVDHGADGLPDDVEMLRVRLHHVHLPKLEDAGLVEYERGEPVALAQLSGDIEDLLDVAGDLEPPAGGPEAVDELLTDEE